MWRPNASLHSHGVRDVVRETGSDWTEKQFELKAVSSKNANDRDMFFLEVKTKNKTYVDMLGIYPENFDEESITKIGSLTEPTTDGNW